MKVKTLTITTISVALLAATAIGAHAQEAPSIGAVTAVTGTEGEGTWTDGDMFVEDGAHMYGNGLMDAPVHFSDPRLPEMWQWGTSESSDDVGAWSGTTQGVTYIDGSADGREGHGSWTGFILEGPLPIQ